MEIRKLMIGDFMSYNNKIWNVQFINDNSFIELIRKDTVINKERLESNA